MGESTYRDERSSKFERRIENEESRQPRFLHSSLALRTSNFSKELLLKRPLPLLPHPFPLHQNSNFLSDAVWKHEPARVLARLTHTQRIMDRVDLDVLEGRKKLMLGGAEGEEEFGLAIEKQSPEAGALPGALEV